MSNSELLSHYVDGEWVSGEPAFESLNPSDTRDVVARVPSDTGKVMNSAVAAAKAAYAGWAGASPEVRSDVLDKVGTTILARKE